MHLLFDFARVANERIMNQPTTYRRIFLNSTRSSNKKKYKFVMTIKKKLARITSTDIHPKSHKKSYLYIQKDFTKENVKIFQFLQSRQ